MSLIKRALKSIVYVSCDDKKKDFLFKGITLVNLMRKSITLILKANGIGLMKWFYDDCIVSVRYNSITYKFYCPYGYDFNIYLNPYFHEYDITSFVYSRLLKGDVFVDVGAHGGLYTIIASQKVGSTGKVIAIEPNPENLKFLEKNIKLNRLNNVTIIPKAASEEKGRVKLFYRKDDTAYTSFTAKDGMTKLIDVETTTLDDFAKVFCSIKIVKIDTEGHDFHVLNGAREILANTKYVIVEQNTTDVSNFLLRFGFDCSKFPASQYLLATKS
jgi:FkbM family methyltransferase